MMLDTLLVGLIYTTGMISLTSCFFHWVACYARSLLLCMACEQDLLLKPVRAAGCLAGDASVKYQAKTLSKLAFN